MSEQAVRTRAGGRDARRTLRNAPDFAMLPSLHRKLPVTELMDPEHVAKIEIARDAVRGLSGLGADLQRDARLIRRRRGRTLQQR